MIATVIFIVICCCGFIGRYICKGIMADTEVLRKKMTEIHLSEECMCAPTTDIPESISNAKREPTTKTPITVSSPPRDSKARSFSAAIAMEAKKVTLVILIREEEVDWASYQT
eukprot:UN29542